MQLRLSPLTVFSFMFLATMYAADDGYQSIRIRNIRHKTVFSVEVPPRATVRQLKLLIEEHEELPVKQQRLFKDEVFEGCCLPFARTIELEDGRLCSSYHYGRYGLIFLYGDTTKKTR